MNRRELILSGAAVLAPIPALAEAASQLPRDRNAEIEAHGEAIMRLVRELFPDANRIGVRLSAYLPAGVEVYAEALKQEWKEDVRLRNGGQWIERSAGSWSSRVGHLD